MDEILRPHGWDDIKNGLADVVRRLQSPPLTTWLQGDHFDAFKQELLALRKDAGNFHKAAVSLDIKIGKWTATPDAVVDALRFLRKQLKA